MKLKEKIKQIKDDYFYKTIFINIFSLLTTLCFAVYNLYLGAKYARAFAIGISIYYFILVLIKSFTLIMEKQIKSKDKIKKEIIRLKNYHISSILIFIVDLCLIAPIILMVTQPRNVNFGLIPAIAMAAYSTYKIVAAIINYRHSRKTLNPTVVLFREISFIDALVSILTLQHTLIMVNGGMNDGMRTLSLCTSIGFIIVVIIFSIVSYIKNKKIFSQNLKWMPRVFTPGIFFSY